MAKKKEEMDEFIDRIYAEVEKDYGKGILVGGSEVIDREQALIPIGPSLDILTGGILEGSFIGISGKPKTGKTITAMQIAANAQKPEFGSRPVFYAKVEGRISSVHTNAIKGLNTKKPHFNIIQSEEGRILTSKDYLQIMTAVLKTVKNAVLIIDSISALISEKELTEGVGVETRGGGAKLFTQFCNNVCNVVPINNSIVIGISHVYANTSGYGEAFLEKSAMRWQHACDYRLRSKTHKPWMDGTRNIGIITTWNCLASPITPPNQTIDSYFRFGVGIDRLYELINFGISIGLVKKAGAWYTMSFMQRHLDLLNVDKWDDNTEKMVKSQGQEGLYQLLVNNPKWAEALDKEIQELAGGLTGSE